MTISTSASSVRVACNGTTTSFNFPFVAGAALNISISLEASNGVVTPLTQGADFSVSLNTPPAGQLWGIGGTITYPLNGVAAAAGSYLIIDRVVPLTQLVTVANQGPFYPEAVERAIDLVEMQVQQVSTYSERAVVVPEVDVNPQLVLPEAAARANNGFGFDGAGNPVMITFSDGSTQLVTAVHGQTAALLGVRFSRFLNVIDDFGAFGDGVHDDTAAIQAGINVLELNGGGKLHFPCGSYAISSTLFVTTSNIQLVGEGRGGTHDTNPVSTSTSSLIWIGPNFGTMVMIQPTANTQRITGWAIEDMALISGTYPYASAAGYGAILSSCAYGRLRVTVQEFKTAAIATTCYNTSDVSSFQFNEIDIVARQINEQGTVLQMGGSSTGNSAFNRIKRVTAEFSGMGIDLQDADNNTFEECYLQFVGAGTGQSLVLRGQTTTNGGFARQNVFEHYSHSVSNAEIFSEGVGTYGSRVVIGAAVQNQILFFDAGNSGFDLNLGSGGSFSSGKNTFPNGMYDLFLQDPSGYKADAAGLYEVWGQVPGVPAGSATVIAYPNGFAFPNGVTYSVFAVGGGVAPYSITGISPSGFTLNVGTYASGGAVTWMWRAYGR